MSKKSPYIPLTIDKAQTKARILAKHGDLKTYCRVRRFATSTLVRILLDSKSAYPYQVREKSTFQKMLRKMKTDGFLVELAEQQLDQAA